MRRPSRRPAQSPRGRWSGGLLRLGVPADRQVGGRGVGGKGAHLGELRDPRPLSQIAGGERACREQWSRCWDDSRCSSRPSRSAPLGRHPVSNPQRKRCYGVPHSSASFRYDERSRSAPRSARHPARLIPLGYPAQVAEVVETTDLTAPSQDGWAVDYRIRREDGEELHAEVRCWQRAHAAAERAANADALAAIADRGYASCARVRGTGGVSGDARCSRDLDLVRRS